MNDHIVVRAIKRVASEVVDGLGLVGSATVHESIGRRGYLGPEITSIQRDVRVSGSAVTVLCHPGDNLMIHAAIEVCESGDILVVANSAPSTHGSFGDLLAASAMARGVRGLVTDAGVRDTAEIRSMGFPVWSRYVSCEGTVKAIPGSVNVPVVFGNQLVEPGDIVCADDDGVVVIPGREGVNALEASRKRLLSEGRTRARLEAGELGVDFYGLRQTLIDVGVEYVDSVDEIGHK